MSLHELGWKPFFQQQLTLDEWDDAIPARVVEQHRSVIVIQTEDERLSLPVLPDMTGITVGDWLLINRENRFSRLLDRQSLFSRKAAGGKVNSQCIAANVDTVFIVSSMNHDFNLNRIERFLALVHEAGAEPVVVLTKADLCEDPQSYLQQVRSMDAMLMVEPVNALDTHSVKALDSWCSMGKTIAFLGSSGVGKSTLVNTLLHRQSQTTGNIREDDSKGRHTTTARSLHPMSSGSLLLDTPGMRELQLADCEQGVEETFADIQRLTQQCQFSDCQHNGEPGCAIEQAIDDGQLEPRRLNNYRKLMREQAMNAATLAEKRARDKSLSRLYQSVQNESRRRKKG
ncbi:GTPase RsgA [Endozoicomonas montiporae]|uniref:Small ribosomal subunit biogenesis GTPase RsgA n=1 Tax=Endozoicomonas montiporae TaxID=1027273 RepID=A0A081N839_9GAMM|nr:GTPase RsgA [Endozoicomonas montiporae]